MNLIGLKILRKIQVKNRGNTKLVIAIDELIEDLKKCPPSEKGLLKLRPDADKVHSDGFYFFDINIHRTLVLIEFDDEGEASIVWAGRHEEYERIFKNNKSTIKKWLKDKGYIE